jgi:DNA-binding NarL/FixJ family response regulator
LDTYARLRPDVVLLDLGLPDESGLAVGKALVSTWPDARIIALTALDDPTAVSEALAIGFRGYLTKDTAVDRFIAAIDTVMQDQIVLPQRIRNRARSGMDEHAALLVSQLTVREREVLGLLTAGLDGPAIARRLGVSRNTVRTHVQSILTKLQVHSRLEAAAFARHHRLVPPNAADRLAE